MLHKIKTTNELSAFEDKLPAPVYAYLCSYLSSLDFDGYALIVENKKDISAISDYIDIVNHPCEEAEIIDGSYLSALYLSNNEYSILLTLPLSTAPDVLLYEL